MGGIAGAAAWPMTGRTADVVAGQRAGPAADGTTGATMGTVAPGRVFGHLRDLVRFDVHPLGSEGGPRASRLYVVVRPLLATILPPTPRPGDRVGDSLRRCSARFTDSQNHRYVRRENEPNNDADVFSNNVSNNFARSSPHNAARSCAHSARSSPLFSHRRG